MNRLEYHRSLAEDFGVDLALVRMMAGVLGPSEDYDGLVTALEDYLNELED
jgi:hypothetical protein